MATQNEDVNPLGCLIFGAGIGSAAGYLIPNKLLPFLAIGREDLPFTRFKLISVRIQDMDLEVKTARIVDTGRFSCIDGEGEVVARLREAYDILVEGDASWAVVVIGGQELIAVTGQTNRVCVIVDSPVTIALPLPVAVAFGSV